MNKEKDDKEAKALSPLALELIASRFRALSEPVRLRLLNLLMQGESAVGQLVVAAGTGQANVSKHLAVLRNAGMVGVRKEGLNSIYFITDPVVIELCDMMCIRLKDEMDRKAEAMNFDAGI